MRSLITINSGSNSIGDGTVLSFKLLVIFGYFT